MAYEKKNGKLRFDPTAALIIDIKNKIGRLPDPAQVSSFQHALDQIKAVDMGALQVSMIRSGDGGLLAEYQAVLGLIHELSGLDYKRAREIIESMK